MAVKALSLAELKETYDKWNREDEQQAACKDPAGAQEGIDVDAMQGLRRVGPL